MRSLIKCHPRQPLRCLQILLGAVILSGFSYMLRNKIQAEDVWGYGESEEAVLGNTMCGQFKSGQDYVIPELKVGKARYDNKRLLRIYDFHYTGNEWESLVSRFDICFATQTSIERIYWLPYILEKWTGPISVAIHLTSDEEWLILNLYMCYLSKCHSGYRNQVSMHLAVPANISGALRVDDSILNQWSDTNLEEAHRKAEACPEAKEYLKYLLDSFPTLEKRKLKFKEVYPQNHMRNIARKACGADWTYSADIDIIPREGMATMLQEFYESRKGIPCEKCAYVIPTFEMNETFPFPGSKADVVKLFENGAARQFHGKYYSPGHKATDYKRWTTTHIKEGPTQISHQILTKETFLYEPFYISPDDIPPFDERFLGYGFTRNSQFKASFIAGWNFSVLTPVFSIHWGLQTAKTVLSPKKDGVGKDVRREQTKENSKLYKKIVEELELKKRLGIF